MSCRRAYFRSLIRVIRVIRGFLSPDPHYSLKNQRTTHDVHNPLRSGKRNRNRRQRKATSSRQRFHNRSPRFESLEQRQMLSVAPAISIGDVTVDVQEGTMEFIDAFVSGGATQFPKRHRLGPDGNYMSKLPY